MITVGFDTSPLAAGHRTRGVGFYTANLLDKLQRMADLKIIEFDDIKKLPEVDLVHYPYFDLFFHSLPQRKKFPVVVTIHDVIPLVFPEHYPAGIKGRLNLRLQRLSLRSVSAVVTNSETSKKDITDYLGVSQDKIHVTYLAPADSFRLIKGGPVLNQVKWKYRLTDKFALFVGSVNWNKNIVNLTRGCIKAGIDLYLVGKNFEDRSNLDHPERRSYKEFLDRYLSHPLVHILGFIENTELVPLLNLASVCLLPSFYEGFGIPVVEAQVCGIPVVTSDTPAMHEVAGSGALFVNPYQVQSISQAILEITQNPSLRLRLTNQGFRNVRRFSWGKTAGKTLAVYKLVCGKGLS